MSVTSVYPSFDAYLGRENNTDGSWATMRAAATSQYQGNYTGTGNSYAGFQNMLPGPGYFTLDRAFWIFGTSAIPDTDEISSAIFSIVKGSLSGDNPDSIAYHLVSVAPASDSAVASGDFDSFGTTSWASRNYADITGTDTRYEWTLNATGIAAVSKTGNTKVGGRGSPDLNNSAPTGYNRRAFYYTSATGTTNDPQLVVTHAAAVATGNSHNNLLLLGVS